jgi:hypothetical protein
LWHATPSRPQVRPALLRAHGKCRVRCRTTTSHLPRLLPQLPAHQLAGPIRCHRASGQRSSPDSSALLYPRPLNQAQNDQAHAAPIDHRYNDRENVQRGRMKDRGIGEPNPQAIARNQTVPTQTAGQLHPAETAPATYSPWNRYRGILQLRDKLHPKVARVPRLLVAVRVVAARRLAAGIKDVVSLNRNGARNAAILRWL